MLLFYQVATRLSLTTCWTTCNKSVELSNLVASCQQAIDNCSTSWEQAVRTHPVDKLLEQHCYKSAAGLLQLVRFLRVYTRTNAQVVTGLQTSCYKSVHKLSTSCFCTACCQQVVFAQAVDKSCYCLFPVVVTSLEQAVNNLWQDWWHYQTCYKLVLTSLIQSWYNKNEIFCFGVMYSGE
jgi:hypothetical protein